jgi:hypothetical protein
MRLLRVIGNHLAGNLVAYLALVMATTGTAYAVATIGSAEVVNDSLKSVDLKDGAAVRSQDVVDDSVSGGGLTGMDIREDTLVLPKESVTLFGDSEGGAGIGHASREIPALDGGAGAFILNDRNVSVDYRCPDYPAENNGELFVVVYSGSGPGDLFIDQGSENPAYYRVPAHGRGVVVPTLATGEATTVSYARDMAGEESLQTLLIFTVGRPGPVGVNNGYCHIQAQMFDAVE